LNDSQQIHDDSSATTTDTAIPRRMVSVEEETLTSDQRLIAMFAHLLGIVSGPLGAFVILLVKKGDAWVESQAREALNFQITVLLVWLCGSVLTLILIGGFIIVIATVLNVVFCVIAAAHVHSGESYRYPLSLRLISDPHAS